MTLFYVAGAIAILFAIALVAARVRTPLGPALKTDREIAQAARQGQLGLAVRSYRELHGVGLKKAKEAMDALVAGGSKSSSEADTIHR
jgi:ribosomal protein L7/L12